VPALSGKVSTGGRVNAQKAVAAAGGGSSSPTPTKTPTPTPTPTPTSTLAPTPTKTIAPLITPVVTQTIAPLVRVLPLPGFTSAPTDPDGDGLYEDLNGNGRADFNDIVLFFNNMEWITANEPVAAFDFSKNGRIDFTDIVRLFEKIG
jgi:PKD repeat protein